MNRPEQQEVSAQCPNPSCRVPINQNRSTWDRIQTTCGRDACRQFLYRTKKAERLDKEREDARISVRQYCADHLAQDLAANMLEVTALLMQMDKEHGHIQAKKIVEAIESKRCKHDKITVLEENAAAARRRADKAEEYNQQLEALYKQRIQELGEEVRVYQSLESAIHGIAQRQLEKQPDE